MTELLARRDSTRFEVSLYPHRVDDGPAMDQRLRRARHHFVDVNHLSNAAQHGS